MDRTRLTRWLIPLPAILFAIWPTSVRAEAQLGIATTYYTIDEIPPIQSDTEYLVCGTEVENNINRNYDYELFEDCTYDPVNDVFICPQPYGSWTLDDNFDWQPPTPMPADASETKRYAWFEPNRVWIELV